MGIAYFTAPTPLTQFWETFHFFCEKMSNKNNCAPGFPEGWGSKDRLFHKISERSQNHGAPWRLFWLHWDRCLRIEHDNKIWSVGFILKFCIRHLAFGFGICLNHIISIAPNIFPCQDKYFSIFAPSPTFLSPLAFSWTQRRPSLSVASPSAALTPLNGPLSVLSPLSSLSSSLPTLLLLLLLLFVSLLFSGSVTYSAKTQNYPFLENFPVSGVEYVFCRCLLK